MDRRTAIAVAAAAAGTVLTLGAAFATNVGLLQHDKPTPISVLDSSRVVPEPTQDPTVVTVVVDDPSIESDAGSTPAATPSAPSASSFDHSSDQASDDVVSDEVVNDSSDDHEDEHEVDLEDHSDDDD
ncbi:MAG: hypothetical protein ACJ739_00160 [Acidimicrobiales bacterium]